MNKKGIRGIFYTTLATGAMLTALQANALPSSNNLSLIQAAISQDAASVAKLVKNGIAVNAVDNSGTTPLMHAAASGNNDIVTALIKAEASLDITNQQGQTALHLAAKNNQLKTVRALIKAGASNDIVDNAGKKALDYAIDKNFVEIAMAIDASAVTIETTEAGLPIVVAAAGGSGISSGTVLTGVGVAAAGGGVAAAAGGGGGGGDSGSGGSSGSPAPAPTPNPPVPPQDSTPQNPAPQNPTPQNPTPPNPDNGNQNNQNNPTPPPQTRQPTPFNITKVNAAGVTQTGSGIRVAVIDTGLFFDHPDLNVNKAISRDFYGNNPDASASPITSTKTIYSAHGTWVTGVINAQDNTFGTVGIAPGAEILALKAGNEFGQLPNSAVIGAMNYASDQSANGGRAKIINNSWGSPRDMITSYTNVNQFLSTSEVNAYSNAVRNNVIVVFAAGNDGFTQVAPQAGLPYLLPELKPLWMAVVAVDSNNSISSFSNRCGVAKAWCLAAPGRGIYTTSDPGAIITSGGITYSEGYFAVNGTSFAAPHVSGAAALLLEKFAAFRADPKKAVERLLESANKTFTGYNADIYGQGLLDVAEALKPAGEINIATSSVIDDTNGTNQNPNSLNSSTFNLGSASGDALQVNDIQIGVLDKYGRFYQFTPQDSVRGEPLDQRLYEFGNDYLASKVQINDRMAVAFTSPENTSDLDTPDNILTFDRASQGDPTRDYELARASFSVDYQGGSTKLLYNMPMDQSFGFGAVSGFNPVFSSVKDAATNPFLGFAQEGSSMISSIALDSEQKTSFRMGSYFGSESITNDITSPEEEAVSGFVGELNHRLSNDINVGFQMGYMSEQGTFLGSRTSGAFETNEGTPTWFSSIAGEYSLTENTSVFMTYSEGVSEPDALAGSLFEDFSSIRSNSFSTGFACKSCIDEKDNLGFVISQPLRVTSGEAKLRLANNTDEAGNIYYETHQFNLAPSGQELDAQAYYGIDLTKKLSIQASATYRDQPQHVQDAEGEGILLLKSKYTW